MREINDTENIVITSNSGLADVILSIMKKDANYDNGSLQSGVFSSFGLACKINTIGLTDYKVRKELKKLNGLGFVKKEKFFVDNESNLKCWKWVLTDAGYNMISNPHLK